MQSSTPSKRLFNQTELLQYLGVSLKKFNDACRRGTCPLRPVNAFGNKRKKLYDRAAVDAWLDRLSNLVSTDTDSDEQELIQRARNGAF